MHSGSDRESTFHRPLGRGQRVMRAVVMAAVLLTGVHVGATPTGPAEGKVGPAPARGRWFGGVLARGRELKQKALQTRYGKRVAEAGGKLAVGLDRTKVVMTSSADAVEGTLTRELKAPLRAVRRYNPLAVFGFLAEKIKGDPVFMTGYGAASTIYANAKTAGMVQAGASPALLAGFRALTTAVDLAAVTLREHQRRTDPSQTFVGTLKNIGQQYAHYTHQQRVENRRRREQERQQAEQPQEAQSAAPEQPPAP